MLSTLGNYEANQVSWTIIGTSESKSVEIDPPLTQLVQMLAIKYGSVDFAKMLMKD